MTLIALLLFLIVLAAFIIGLSQIRPEDLLPKTGRPPIPSAPPPPMYRKRVSVMNKSEQAFFFELQKQLPPSYHIFPNMRIADFIDAVDGKGFYNRRNKILPKHVDFLICDTYFKPLIAIEVNGSSHRRADRIERDELVRKIFEDAKLPLEFVEVGTSFEKSVARVKSYLS